VRFECHSTRGDPIEKIGTHIGEPIIHGHGGGHFMKNLRKELTRGIEFDLGDEGYVEINDEKMNA